MLGMAGKDRADDVRIMGFRTQGDLFRSAHTCAEDDWDYLRATFAAHASGAANAKKEEVASSDEDECLGHEDVVETSISRVFNLQQACSAVFRDGRPLHVLIHELRTKRKDPLKDDFLILNVARACIQRRGSRRPHSSADSRAVVYYTLDHRRLHCLREAGCSRLRVRVRLAGREVDEFVKKAAESLGQRTAIRVRPGARCGGSLEKPDFSRASASDKIALQAACATPGIMHGHCLLGAEGSARPQKRRRFGWDVLAPGEVPLETSRICITRDGVRRCEETTAVLGRPPTECRLEADLVQDPLNVFGDRPFGSGLGAMSVIGKAVLCKEGKVDIKAMASNALAGKAVAVVTSVASPHLTKPCEPIYAAVPVVGLAASACEALGSGSVHLTIHLSPNGSCQPPPEQPRLRDRKAEAWANYLRSSSPSVYLSDVPVHWTKGAVSRMCSEFGEVLKVDLQQPQSSRSFRAVIVRFRTQTSADNCTLGLKGKGLFSEDRKEKRFLVPRISNAPRVHWASTPKKKKKKHNRAAL